MTALHIACNIDIALKWNNHELADALIAESKNQHSAPTNCSPTLIDSVKLGYFYAKKKATELFSRLKF